VTVLPERTFHAMVQIIEIAEQVVLLSLNLVEQS